MLLRADAAKARAAENGIISGQSPMQSRLWGWTKESKVRRHQQLFSGGGGGAQGAPRRAKCAKSLNMFGVVRRLPGFDPECATISQTGPLLRQDDPECAKAIHFASAKSRVFPASLGRSRVRQRTIQIVLSAAKSSRLHEHGRKCPGPEPECT